MTDTRHWCEGVKGLGWESHDSDEWYEVQFRSDRYDWMTYHKYRHDWHDDPREIALQLAQVKRLLNDGTEWRVMHFAEHRTTYKEEIT